MLIRNIPHETGLTLESLVTVLPGQIVSRTLAQNGAVSLTLFAFDADTEISAHASEGDAMVTVLTGSCRYTVDGTPHLLHAGETMVMPAGKPHAVHAPEACKWLLTVVFPGGGQATEHQSAARRE